MAIPLVDDIDRISALADPVIRNLQITQCYHELALALTTRTGLCANWCTFATWASRQAGQTIRKEDLARAIEYGIFTAQAMPEIVASAQELGSQHDAAEIEEAVAQVLNPLGAFERASAAVGRGNRKVFEEIGREFARFVALCLSDTVYDSQNIDHFCATLRPGEPPDGQQYLRQAFQRYYAAFFEPDAKTRAELMLLANIEIGFHEQTRLQPEIAEAMSAAFVDIRQFRVQLIRTLFPQWGWLVRLRLFLLRLFDRPNRFDRVIDLLVNEARRQAHLIITEYLMVIGLPGGVRLRLGSDLQASFPASLEKLTLADLCALMEKLDPTPDSTGKTGAVNWSHLPDRIHFILDMFRCYHETAALFEPPFTADQVAALKAGRLPPGPL